MTATDLYEKMKEACGGFWQTDAEYKLWDAEKYPGLTTIAEEIGCWIAWADPQPFAWSLFGNVNYVCGVDPVRSQPMAIPLEDWLAHLKLGRFEAINQQLERLPYVDEGVWDADDHFFRGLESFIESGLGCYGPAKLHPEIFGSNKVKFDLTDAFIIEARYFRFLKGESEREHPCTAEELFEESCEDFFHNMEDSWEIEPKGLEEFQTALDVFYKENEQAFKKAKTQPGTDLKELEKVITKVSALYDDYYFEPSVNCVQLCDEWWIAQGGGDQ